MKSNYEERKQNRIEAYERLAEKNRMLSNEKYEQSRKMAGIIPFGQPILIGHHSEKKHRRHLDRIHNTMGKAVELDEKASYYENKIAAVESNRAISQDDPEALVKLKEKLASLEKNQEDMKALNKLIKKNDRDGMAKRGLSENEINSLFTPDFMGRIGFPSYSLTNNNANIKRLKKRIEIEEKKNSQKTKEIVIGDIRIVDNVEDNRFQIFFPGIPSESIRKALKSNGFKWAPSVKAWQRFRVVNTQYLVDRVKGILENNI